MSSPPRLPPAAREEHPAHVCVAQIGCGYWGPKLLRNFSSQPGCHVKWVAEKSPVRRDYVKQHYPAVQTASNWQEVLDDPEVEAVIIATPAATHHPLTRAVLQAGKHAFVEKPLATCVRDAEELAVLAQTQQRTLMVGHTFLYNPAVVRLKQLLDEGHFGQVFHLYSQRLNLGQVRPDVNVWWSLAPHDISILLYLLDGALPATVEAQGADYLQPGTEDVVFASLTWSNRITAQVHVSWLDPGKVRRLTLVGSRRMAVFDDTAADKLVVFDKGVDWTAVGEGATALGPGAYRLHHRAEREWLPAIEPQEPLNAEAAHFLHCVRTGLAPLTGPSHARDVVAVLEAGECSLREKGRGVALDR